MTPGELENLKEKIKSSMVDHLTKTIGYPDCGNEEIMKQLKPMWIKLEDEGLIVKGMSFEAFAIHAEHAFTFQEIRDTIGI